MKWETKNKVGESLLLGSNNNSGAGWGGVSISKVGDNIQAVALPPSTAGGRPKDWGEEQG